MFTRKRVLKKNKANRKYKTIFLVIFVVSIFLITASFISTFYSFGKRVYISPIASSRQSNLSPLEQLLKQSNISYANVYVNQDMSYTVKLSEGGEVILSSKKDIRSQLSSLQLILSRLTIEGKKLKILDFRFNRPVISF